MKKILLISDTHGYCGEDVLKYVRNVDELWHAGDIGDLQAVNVFEREAKSFRAVYGNIDGHLIRRSFPEFLQFDVEGVSILMTHIGGYPGRYAAGVKNYIDKYSPKLFISGHSHITKVMRDPVRDLLHMNPGSCGHHGFHVMRTMLRFELENGKIDKLEVIELGLRGRANKKNN